ncbi:MAG: polysaccharide pyruvyl transferase family protein, partial [Paraclostridium sp.]
GPLTYKLLANSFIDTTNVIMSGDPGFLLQPEELNKDVEILKFCKNDKVVGINWGTCMNRIYGKNEKYVEDNLVKVCKDLILKGYKLYLYTMWDSDIKHLKNLYNRINDNQNVILDTKLHPAGQMLNILKRCHFTINLKLHANIISSVANTPFICLGYRFKTIDFTKSINSEELLVLTDEKDIDYVIKDKIKYIENNYTYVKAKLKLELGKYNNSLESMFKEELYK